MSRLLAILCSSGVAAGLVVTTARLRRARHAKAPPHLLLSGAGAGTTESPRVARDDAWAEAILQAWRADEDIRASAARGDELCREAVVYRDEQGEAFHGEFFWAEGRTPAAGLRAGVVLVHTAVGPRDLMLQWRAQSLAALGYVVLIADLLGDATGAGWDGAWAAPRRAALVEDRELSRRRMTLAVETLTSAGGGAGGCAPAVDSGRIAALGYCFGGRSVLDFARANPRGLRGAPHRAASISHRQQQHLQATRRRSLSALARPAWQVSSPFMACSTPRRSPPPPPAPSQRTCCCVTATPTRLRRAPRSLNALPRRLPPPPAPALDPAPALSAPCLSAGRAERVRCARPASRRGGQVATAYLRRRAACLHQPGAGAQRQARLRLRPRRC